MSFVYLCIVLIIWGAIGNCDSVTLKGDKLDTLDGITLAFAIDNTGSMWDDINGVKIALKAIMEHVRDRKKHPVVNFVLSTFNDPDPPVVYKTEDTQSFEKRLNTIKVYGGGDCPELAMSGIKAAIEASLENSIVYVFTDASAKDMRVLGDEVIQLSKKKHVQITFLLTGECRKGVDDDQFKIYDRLASVTMGRVYHIGSKHEVPLVLKFIAESLDDKSKVIASGKAEKKDEGTGRYEKGLVVDVDESMESFTVILNGLDPKIVIISPENDIVREPQVNTKLDMREILVQEVKNPLPGRWTINCSTSNPHSSEIKTSSGIDFLYGFSFSSVKTLDKTTENPYGNTRSYLSVRPIIDDSYASWNPKAASFINLSGKPILQPLVLTRVPRTKNIFQSLPFAVPDESFYIAITGYDAMGNTVKRISKTVINPEKSNDKKVDGIWSKWSEWTKCSVPCGAGMRFKYRQCNNPKPLNGGKYCEGSFVQRERCNTHPCPINGGWTNFGNWTTCTASCGKGLRTAYRKCTNPIPKYGGKSCLGEDFKTEECELKICNPEAIILSINGLINGKYLTRNISVNLINNFGLNPTTLKIATNDILGSKSTWSPTLYPFIMSSVAWLFAKELKNSSNGLTLSKGNFHLSSNIKFHSGEKLNVRHRGHGVNADQTLLIHIKLNGEVPSYAKKSAITMLPNTKTLLQTEPGRIDVIQTLNHTRGDDADRGYDLVEIYNYNDKLKFMPFVRQNIQQSRIRSQLTSGRNDVLFSTDSSLAPDNLLDCPSGYMLESGKYCSDIDECELKTHSCSHLCQNLMGSYKCSCPEHMLLKEDGRNCIEDYLDGDYSDLDNSSEY